MTLPVVVSLSLWACDVRTPCEQGACSGCCDDAGECQPGDEINACGTGGASCLHCVLDRSCVAGTCVLALPDGGLGDGGFEGTVWMAGPLVADDRLDLARVSARLGVSELMAWSRPDGGQAALLAVALAPEGDRLAATLSWAHQGYDLVLVDVDGSGPPRVVVSGAEGTVPRVVDVSAGLVTWAAEMTPDSFATPLDGGATVRITPHGWDPSPGSMLFFAHSRDDRYVSVVAELASAPGARRVWVTDLGAAMPAPVEVFTAAQAGGSATSNGGPEGYAGFTADGYVVFRGRFDATSSLPFALVDGGVAYRLVRLRPDGTGVERLPFMPLGDEQVGQWGLSDDESQLAFALSPSPGHCAVYVMPSDASMSPRRITVADHAGQAWYGQPLVFSPDAHFVGLAANWGGGAYAPWAVATDGTWEARLFDMPASGFVHGRVRWAPDGLQLGFLSDHLSAGHEEVFRVGLGAAGATPSRVFPLASGRVERWWWTRR